MQVLIVEDDIDTREALCATLELEGHDVVGVPDGREALAHLAATPRNTCVILLDLMMPIMNGWEFREAQLRDDRISSIPVVVITADGNALEKARKMSAAGFLTKPLDPDRLIETVGKFCSKPN